MAEGKALPGREDVANNNIEENSGEGGGMRKDWGGGKKGEREGKEKKKWEQRL